MYAISSVNTLLEPGEASWRILPVHSLAEMQTVHRRFYCRYSCIALRPYALFLEVLHVAAAGGMYVVDVRLPLLPTDL